MFCFIEDNKVISSIETQLRNRTEKQEPMGVLCWSEKYS